MPDGNNQITFFRTAKAVRFSHIAGGEVALVPAAGLVGDGAAEEAFLQKRIEVLPGRLFVLIAQIRPDLGDASRRLPAEGQNLILNQARRPVRRKLRQLRRVALVKAADIGLADVQIGPEEEGNIAVGMAAVFGNQAQRNRHDLFHLFLQRPQHQVQLTRLEGRAGGIRLPHGEGRKLQRLPGQQPVLQPERVPLTPGLMPRDHPLTDLIIIQQLQEGAPRQLADLFILRAVEDGHEINLGIGPVQAAVDLIAAPVFQLLPCTGEIPRAIFRSLHRKDRNAGGHREH